MLSAFSTATQSKFWQSIDQGQSMAINKLGVASSTRRTSVMLRDRLGRVGGLRPLLLVQSCSTLVREQILYIMTAPVLAVLTLLVSPDLVHAEFSSSVVRILDGDTPMR